MLAEDPSIREHWLRAQPVDSAELADAVVRLAEALEAAVPIVAAGLDA